MFALLDALWQHRYNKRKVGGKVRSVFKKITVFLAFVMCFALVSCAGEGNAETTAPDTTEKITAPPETEVTEPTKEVTYTVPLKKEKDGKLQWEYTYSADGMTLSKTDYTEETPITYTVYFDENGLPLKREWIVTINDTRTEKWRDDYYLDEEGKIIEEKRYCEGQIQTAYAYTYEDDGKIATQNSRNVKQENTIYRLLYDEMRTHVGTRFSRYNGERGYYHEEKTCTYDEAGRVLTEKTESLTISHEYILTSGLVTQEKITNEGADYKWSYYYGNTYENGCLVRKDCYYDGTMTDSEYFGETEYKHFYDAINWIFRERLP